MQTKKSGKNEADEHRCKCAHHFHFKIVSEPVSVIIIRHLQIIRAKQSDRIEQLGGHKRKAEDPDALQVKDVSGQHCHEHSCPRLHRITDSEP